MRGERSEDEYVEDEEEGNAMSEVSEPGPDPDLYLYFIQLGVGNYYYMIDSIILNSILNKKYSIIL